ncbi:MAG TPA: hypothetical protein PK264_15655 [Hyphomicrobiaceae bacterium]|nr:hypothetical protein [Hyphomicrobiaceae bacterium]
MRRFIFAVLILACALATPPLLSTKGRLQAGRNAELPTRTTTLELVVVEVDQCRHCAHFREAIAPGYRKTWLEKRAPLRFVEAAAFMATSTGLRQPIDTVPTAILMADGVEVDRVTGLLDPEMFYEAVTFMIERSGV